MPHGAGLAALLPLLPVFLSYVLSFVYVGIYWNNHHHMLQAAEHVNGRILWANLHLLFWLSLMPFTTAWMGENHYASLPVAMYGLVLMMAGFAYTILTRALVKHHGRESLLATAIGRDRKGWLSLVLYALAIPLAFPAPLASCAIYVLVAMIWLVPDTRIERVVATRSRDS